MPTPDDSAAQDRPDDQPNRKASVFTEEVKQQHVSHWDWDYLSSEELDQLHEEKRADEPGTT